jgi:F-box domain
MALSSYLGFRHRQSISLTKIPQEIVAVILTHLSTSDQICFALTCKSFYNYYIRLFLATQGIQVDLSRLIPAKQREAQLYRNTHIQNEPWIQLLKQLENRRWKYCCGCWRLHQRSAWRRPSLITTTPTTESCMPYAGTQDICPCLTITYTDKIHLINLLESVRKRESTTRVYYYDKILYHPVADFGPTCVGHQCILTDQHPLAHVGIHTLIDWDREGDKLRVRSRYTFSDSTQNKEFLQRQNSSNKSSSPQVVQRAPSAIQTSLMCPHKRTRKWLGQFFKESGIVFSGFSLIYMRVGNNQKCHCGKAKKGRYRSYDGLSIFVQQDMGGIKWLGKAWRRDLELFLGGVDEILTDIPVIFPDGCS